MTQVSIGELLRRHRLEASLTQKELADRMDYHNSVVSRVERNRQLPTSHYLDMFIQVLTLSQDEQDELEVVIGRIGTTASRRPREDWEMCPDTQAFRGRNQELEQLKTWVVSDRCRLVGVFGMGGIGKTSLVARFAHHTKNEFEWVIWRSLLNAPPLEDLLSDCIQLVSGQRTASHPSGVDKGIALLIEHLRKHRCLLVLDNFEAVLPEEDCFSPYHTDREGYAQFLLRIGKVQHQSCIVITSRERPPGFDILESKASSTRTLHLKGLGEAEVRSVLRDKGLSGPDETWSSLASRYSGNPLALKIVAETIREVFDGDVKDFLGEEVYIFGGVYSLLDQQFDRLSGLEQGIVYWLAVEREPASADKLYGNMVGPVLKRDIINALHSLRRRSLIEQSQGTFMLQNVVMEYMTARVIDKASRELITGTVSILQHLTLMKGQAPEYVRENQKRLILRPIANRLAKASGQAGAEDMLNGILSSLRGTDLSKPGYAAGNVLNLLVELGCDLREYDLSSLTIWQAYLKDVDLQRVDLRDSDLTGSVFSEAFGSVYSIAFDSKGEYIAAGNFNGEIQVWRTIDRQRIFKFKGHMSCVWGLVFHPHKDILVSSSDQVIKLWDIDAGQSIRTLFGHTDWVTAISISSDGDVLASGSDDQTIRLWNMSTGKCFRILREHTNHVTALAFGPDTSSLASGSYDQTVRLWDCDGRCLRTLDSCSSWIWSLDFSPEGSLLVAGSEEGLIYLWDTDTGQVLQILEGHNGAVRCVTFDSTGEKIASSGIDQTVKIWDAFTGQCLKTFRGHDGWARTIDFRPSSSILASGGDDKIIRLWDVDRGTLVGTFRGYSNTINAIDFNFDGQILAGGGDNQAVQLWDMDTGQSWKKLKGNRRVIWSLAFSPTENVLACANGDRTVRLWHIETEKCLQELHYYSWTMSVVFHPLDDVIACSHEDCTITLWDIKSGELINVLEGHKARIMSIDFSPGGKVLASGSNDQTVRLWDAETGQEHMVLYGHTDRVWTVTFDRSGSIIASGGYDRIVRLWNVESGRQIGELRGHTSVIRSIAANPTKDVLASGCSDGSIRLWSIGTRECLQILEGHTAQVLSVAFHPDGETLASGSDDETVRIWNPQTGECVRTLMAERLYEGMNIKGVKGLTEAQKKTLRQLGAVEEASMRERSILGVK
jgi:WD40 repeat protein/transcriptional regulator with XRE-family HTH domain